MRWLLAAIKVPSDITVEYMCCDEVAALLERSTRRRLGMKFSGDLLNRATFAPGFSFPWAAPLWCILTPLHVQNGRLGSAPAADPGKVLASVHRLEGQDVPSGGGLAGEQPGRSRGAAVSRSGRSTELA